MSASFSGRIMIVGLLSLTALALGGCSWFEPNEQEKAAQELEQQNTEAQKRLDDQARAEEEKYNPKKSKPKKPARASEDEASAPAKEEDWSAHESGSSTVVNVNNAGGGFSPAFWRKPAPAVEIPAPELANVNRYARALEQKLLRRYTNTPAYSGQVAKVQLLPLRDPEISLDGRKLRMEWSQVVYDIWGKRIPELEKEYYIVTFGDGKPLMQRTRPTITVGLNNESGYSEFGQVRGGVLSQVAKKANPAMFDKPDSERTGPLEEGVKAKDSADAPYLEYELPPIGSKNSATGAAKTPVIAPAADNLQAVVVLDRLQD